MITNTEARDEIMTRIDGDKKLFRADGARYHRIARRERIISTCGGVRWHAIHSPAGARDHSSFGDRIIFYGANGTLAHEEPATGPVMEWFDRAFAA